MHSHFKNCPQWKKVLKVADLLHNNGFLAFAVGGCVRDFLLKRQPKDFDMVTDASIESLIKIFPEALTIATQFSVIILPYKDSKNKNFQIELSSFRKDGQYTDGRRPDKVTPGSIKEDAARRDFSINALFYNLQTKKILDFYNGQEDLKKKVIKTVGQASQRFKEDHLRLLRAVRFSVELNFKIDKQTDAAILEHQSLLKTVSKERIGQEFKKIIFKDAVKGLNILQEKSLLKIILQNFNYLDIQKSLIKLDTSKYLLKQNFNLEFYFLILSLIINKSFKQSLGLPCKQALLFIEDLKNLKFTKTEVQLLKDFLNRLSKLHCFCLTDFLKNSDLHNYLTDLLFLNSKNLSKTEDLNKITDHDIDSKKFKVYYEFIDLMSPSKETYECIKCIIDNDNLFLSELINNLKIYLKVYLQIINLIDKKEIIFPKWQSISSGNFNINIAPHNRSKLLNLIYAQNIIQKIKF